MTFNQNYSTERAYMRVKVLIVAKKIINKKLHQNQSIKAKLSKHQFFVGSVLTFIFIGNVYKSMFEL